MQRDNQTIKPTISRLKVSCKQPRNLRDKPMRSANMRIKARGERTGASESGDDRMLLAGTSETRGASGRHSRQPDKFGQPGVQQLGGLREQGPLSSLCRNSFAQGDTPHGRLMANGQGRLVGHVGAEYQQQLSRRRLVPFG